MTANHKPKDCDTCQHRNEFEEHDDACWQCSRFYTDKWEAMPAQVAPERKEA